MGNEKETMLLHGVTNFRDIGGYRTLDGRVVKSGKLFRSDSLHALNDDDINALKKMGLKLIVDYRPSYERDTSPNVHITGTIVKNLQIDGAKIEELALNGKLHTLGKSDEIMPRYYRALINSTKTYKELFELILTQNNVPMVQHCTAGKDRTGIGTALILLALGVSEEVVLEDYLLSNNFRKQYNTSTINEFESKLQNNELDILRALLDVRKEYLEAAFDEIKVLAGSIDDYLEKHLGLTPEKRIKLQENFLI